ncbi:MAG: PolC-type DNA polymerase III, partial [Bacilli bacterium]|nr:PolC-type DNA polymerase III [Bacilli bacterium]
DPTMLKMLEDSSGIKIDDIPFDDKDVFKLFSSTESLGVSSEEIECEVGTLGVPEFGTNFVIEMLKDTRPENFAELVKISGLSHGTDVWLSNAKNLIENNTVDFKDLIGCRDDIMVYLIYQGLKPKEAFDIMEFVRKGKASKDKETWEKHASTMRKANVPEWYIDSCQRIKYMFPKAHATAYVMMALRVAWFKVHYPIFYYSAYFSIRATDFDIKTMIKGYSSIKEKISILKEKGFEATNKEVAILDVLKSALEMTARGFKFGNVDIYKSDSTKFLIDEDKKTLIPPFISIDGLGDIVAKKIVEERNIKAFTSIDDFQNRGKVSQTIINNMRLMGILDQMPDTSQLSLF